MAGAGHHGQASAQERLTFADLGRCPFSSTPERKRFAIRILKDLGDPLVVAVIFDLHHLVGWHIHDQAPDVVEAAQP